MTVSPARIGEVDLLRGIAILAVIGIHASMNFSPLLPADIPTLALIALNTALQFAVPLFIFISGFVLSLRHHGQFSKAAFYSRRAYAILPQYALFSIIYLVGKAAFYGPVGLFQAAYDLLTAGSSYHLWFIAVIAELYLLYPAIIRVYGRMERSGKEKQLLLLCLIVQIVWSSAWFVLASFETSDLTDLMHRFFPISIFYFVAGIYAARHYGTLRTSPFLKLRYFLPVVVALTALIASTVVVNMWMAGQYPLLSLPTLALLVVPRALAPVLDLAAFGVCFIASTYLMGSKSFARPALRTLGKYAFGIYLIHAGFLALAYPALGRAGIAVDSPVFFPALFGSTLLLSYGSVYALSYLPYSTALVGTHNEAGKRVPD